MIFGKIDYINLLPFHIFLKGSSLQNAFKQSIEYNKGVPSELNKKLRLGRVDAAVISSVQSDKPYYKKLDFGIVANKKVNSVLVKKNTQPKLDAASASSNALAKILKLKGEVVIGDRALQLYLQNPDEFIDLVTVWYEKHKLPFVFGRLCVRGHHKFFERLYKSFLRKNVKIPNYILKKYSRTRGISEQDIKDYLQLIYYTVGIKEKRALKKFLTSAKRL